MTTSSIRVVKFHCLLLAPFKALGLTQTELEQALANKFRSQYLKNPKVTVTIATLRPFYIDGRGRETGRISLQEWPQRAHRNSHSLVVLHIEQTVTAVQIQRHGRDQHARISHIGIGSNPTRRRDSSS